MGWVHKENSTGPRTEPCGTPYKREGVAGTTVLRKPLTGYVQKDMTETSAKLFLKHQMYSTIFWVKLRDLWCRMLTTGLTKPAWTLYLLQLNKASH